MTQSKEPQSPEPIQQAQPSEQQDEQQAQAGQQQEEGQPQGQPQGRPEPQPQGQPQGRPQGLTSQEVAERVAKGDVNVDANVKTRSIKQIVHENVFTLFNAVNVILAIFVFLTGSYKNMLFMVIIVSNACIGIFQEIRSKKTTDALSIVAAAKARTLRDGQIVELALSELVRDDIIELSRGSQVPADAVVVQGSCDVNESLLTGESKLIKKQVGDDLMSGSFVNSGSIWAKVVHVGAENYAARISDEAKAHKKVNSEIMNSLNGIIKFVSCIIFPVGALLFAREHFISGVDINSSILSTTSALIGMVPEGLILLTSTVLAVAVVRLAQSHVLVQQLYCIETLARVDTLCLDKTGTITTGHMAVSEVKPLGDADASEVDRAFASIAAADPDPNETALAIISHYGLGAADEGAGAGGSGGAKGRGTAKASAAAATATSASSAIQTLTPTRMIAFSSDKKWSGATFDDGSAYVMGAAQFVMKERFSEVEAQVNELAQGARVLLLARVEGFTPDGDAQGDPKPIGLVGIHDEIRATAEQTIGYFKEQGVTVKVISGDDPHTVSGIAQKVGVPNAEKFKDATELKSDDDIASAIEEYAVFGRVKPEQKKAFVLALQSKGHVVAMTGDGVNDTLALKASDCSVAMASGSDAARNVAQLVLVDNDFASMPKVVAEGRRSINNLQRSASLFLVKTIFSITCALLFIFLPWEYPFQPIQMALVSAFTIGIPSFVLALEPNRDRIKGKFLQNAVVKSIPGALCVIAMLLTVNGVGYGVLGLDYSHVSTLCVLLTAWIGVMLVVRLSIPYTLIRAGLLVVVVGGLSIGAFALGRLFSLQTFSPQMWVVFGIAAAVTFVVFNVLFNVITAAHEKRLARMV